ncbi:hypothetical protein BOTBODRAFT_323300 [Botryobasidium botryosum FD-172 SS1]|uniref:Uncharacterized protein n=1 Tax=Botryobasidium botryosum (strain FD-172 SS1) TaxID=930990 RepID=A0A067N1W8_BOTB1|nr:hypothetical protein BOTBODRAFT_323300 [Botryobasidium botryosum FD-172 SS1]
MEELIAGPPCNRAGALFLSWMWINVGTACIGMVCVASLGTRAASTHQGGHATPSLLYDKVQYRIKSIKQHCNIRPSGGDACFGVNGFLHHQVFCHIGEYGVPTKSLLSQSSDLPEVNATSTPEDNGSICVCFRLLLLPKALAHSCVWGT